MGCLDSGLYTGMCILEEAEGSGKGAPCLGTSCPQHREGGALSHQPSSLTCFSPSLQLCEDLFSRINDTTNDNMSYSVEVGLPACSLFLSVDLGSSRCGW